MIDLGQKTHTRKTTAKTVWSLRETDRFGIISGMNEKVYFSVHFFIYIFTELRGFYAIFSNYIFTQMSDLGKICSKPRFRRGFRSKHKLPQSY